MCGFFPARDQPTREGFPQKKNNTKREKAPKIDERERKEERENLEGKK